MAITALKYQVKPIRVLKEALDEKGQALCVMAMGLGKTIVSAFVVEDYLNVGKRGLFLCHENDILEQAEGTYREVIGNHINYSTFYGDEKDWYADRSQMLFASFQSMNNHHAEWYKVFDPEHFDFLVVDEGHHGQADTYRPVIEYFNCKKLALTGTPDREDGRDIRDLFGEEVVDIPLEVGIAHGWLTHIEYHILSDGINNRKLKQILKRVLKGKERVSIKQLNETIFINARTHQQRLIVNEYAEIKKRSGGKKTMIFCENITHAEHVAGYFENGGVIHSKRSKGENREVLRQFRTGELQYLTSVDKMNEGIDVPDVQVEAFLRATDSKRVWYQQTGRGARKAPGKEKLVILDFVANVDRLLMIRELMDRIEKEVEQDEELKGKLSKRQFNVSGEGFDFIFSDDLVDLLKVIKVLRDGFYKTWQEASASVMRLGIRCHSQYRKRYKEDRKLPSAPEQVYQDYPGNFMFFRGEKRKVFYKTWKQASRAAKKLGIKNYPDYRERYKGDPKLPYNPQATYKDFPSWQVFLPGTRIVRRREKMKPYKTWRLAARVARQLGYKTRNAYAKGGYMSDPKLPRSPQTLYEDFPGWPMFLRGENGLYPTWKEAAKVARKLGARTPEQYRSARRKDKGLPSNPGSTYPDFPGYPKFLRGEDKERRLMRRTGRRRPFYQSWKAASRAARKRKFKNQKDYLRGYYVDPKLPSNPASVYADFPGWYTFLTRKEKEFYSNWRKASKAAKLLGIKNSHCYTNLQHYKRDPGLHSRPEIFYKDFPGWKVFLGKQRQKKYKAKK